MAKIKDNQILLFQQANSRYEGSMCVHQILLVPSGIVVALALVVGCGRTTHLPDGQSVVAESASTGDSTASKSVTLFDGNLANWKITNFGGEGDVSVENGEIQLSAGYPMTGITWNGDQLPTEDYEISLQARKLEGNDFFCGLTFPVGDGHCSLILGGWGGSLVGLSCIDGDDASNNGTKQYRNFTTDQWYAIKVFVDADGIEVSLDDEVIIDQARGEHEFTVRNETLPCRPLGICTYQTTSALRNIVLTRHN